MPRAWQAACISTDFRLRRSCQRSEWCWSGRPCLMQREITKGLTWERNLTICLPRKSEMSERILRTTQRIYDSFSISLLGAALRDRIRSRCYSVLNPPSVRIRVFIDAEKILKADYNSKILDVKTAETAVTLHRDKGRARIYLLAARIQRPPKQCLNCASLSRY